MTIVPLSPISFLNRSAAVYCDKPAMITARGHTETYGEFLAEARRVVAGLRTWGVTRGSRVALLARNGPDALRMHYAVPGAGAALVALNTRLSPQEYAFILKDCTAEILLIEPALRDRIAPVAAQLSCRIIELADSESDAVSTDLGVPYQEWLDGVDDRGQALALPSDENDAIAVNYTSGTTGTPKGAIYTHRGAYLNSLGVALELQVGPQSTYLWTLPMFHCNGWCFTWAVTAVGATHISLRDFDAATALEMIGRHGVSHFCGAPVVLNALAEQGDGSRHRFDQKVTVATGGAPPLPSTIADMRSLGIDVVHLYGLTETYGPSLICEMQPGWEGLDPAAFASVLARQGVQTLSVESVRVVDDNFDDVPADGESMGEIVVRSNTVVPGYLGNREGMEDQFKRGWLLTGDIAVVHDDGYIEVRDRRKDIIISGGENVASIEVEQVLSGHPQVVDVAVVACGDDTWGEVPVAFVEARAGTSPTEGELIDYVRERLAHFKAPKAVKFGALPRTSTGKVQKIELRERAKALPRTSSA